jgi:hypothetical protein
MDGAGYPAVIGPALPRQERYDLDGILSTYNM